MKSDLSRRALLDDGASSPALALAPVIRAAPGPFTLGSADGDGGNACSAGGERTSLRDDSSIRGRPPSMA